jgi:hypothetical protein
LFLGEIDRATGTRTLIHNFSYGTWPGLCPIAAVTGGTEVARTARRLERRGGYRMRTTSDDGRRSAVMPGRKPRDNGGITMNPIDVMSRPRSRFTVRFVGPCIAVVLLSAGVLYATTRDGDVPPPVDTQRPSPGSPPPRFFGLVHLTGSHVARLHFANPELPGPGPNNPAIVRLEFVDSLGNVLLRQGPEVVMPGDMMSLDLVTEGLPFPPGSNQLGVRGLVTFFNPQATGLASLQVEDTATNSSAILLDRVVRSVYFVRKLDLLCTHPTTLSTGSLMRINVTNAGDRGFPDARLAAELVIYRMRPQQEVARKPVQLELGHSDSLVVDNVAGGEFFGTVEFKDSASQVVAAGTYEFRQGADGNLNVYTLSSCRGPWDSSSTSGGTPTNSGGAGH